MAALLLLFVMVATACSSSVTIQTTAAPASAESAPIDSGQVEPAQSEPRSGQRIDVPDAAVPDAAVPGTTGAAAVPSSPRPEDQARDDAPPIFDSVSEASSLGLVRSLASETLSADELASHKDHCAANGEALRSVGNTVAVTNVKVTGEPWTSTLITEVADETDYGFDDSDNWDLCVVLVPAAEELKPCADNRPGSGLGRFSVEGVQAIAFLENAGGQSLVANSTVVFGFCPYGQDEDGLRALKTQIDAQDGRIASDLSLPIVERFVREVLDLAVALDGAQSFSDAQCQALGAALVARANFVVAANETFGMDTFGRLGSSARVPTSGEARTVLEHLRVAGRAGTRAQLQFFRPRTQFLRAFQLEDDAAQPYGSVYSWTRWETYTPHDAVAHFADSAAFRPHQADQGETFRRGLQLIEAGCSAEQLSETAIQAAAGMEPFDAQSSDTSLICGWLQASYGYRLEYRRALAAGDFVAADKMSRSLTWARDQHQEMFEVEKFLSDLVIYAFASVERSMMTLVNPDDAKPPGFDEHLPGYQQSQDEVDAFAISRCTTMPSFLLDVPTLAQVEAGAPAAPEMLPPLPESEGYRTACEGWVDYFEARSTLWATLPDAPSTASPGTDLLDTRRALDAQWVSKQSVMSITPGFAPRLDSWNVLTTADRSLWLAATQGQTVQIDAEQVRIANDDVIDAVRRECGSEIDIDPAGWAAALPALANS